MKPIYLSLSRSSVTVLRRVVLAASVITLVACGESITVNGPVDPDTNSPDATDTDTTDPDTTTEAQQGGDAYWAELAQSYEPFDKPDLGAAYPEDQRIFVGQWEPTFDWPIIATGAANLPDGRVAAWSSQQVDGFAGNQESTHGTIYDPTTNSFTSTPNSTHDMFCAGVSLLEDGRVFIAGGGKTVSTTSIFDNDEFTEIEPMALTRWYPTSTTLASGQVFTSLGTTGSPYPELWTDGEGWSLLSNVNLQKILDGEAVIHNDWYPAFNVAPDGSLFHPGHMPDMLSVYMKQEDSVHDHGEREPGEGSRLYNTTVMYDIGKMLVAGGGAGDDATNSAMTMDVNGPSPVITPTNPMKHVRSMQNSVVLPNGEVLVIGGNSSGIQFSDDGTVLEPEVWNPITEQWRVMDYHDKPRNYHSVALLMKDARVLVAGGGLCGNCPTNHQNGEIFKPPYLFNVDGTEAQRPAITSGAETALPGETIALTGTDNMVKFNMLRLVAITHHHTTDQRFVPIDSIKSGTGEYQLTLNSNPNVLLPGYYWIFGLDENGIPTEGHTVQIGVTPDNQPDVNVDNSPNIAFEYYEENWGVWELPDFDTLTPVKTGTQSDFSLTQKERNNQYAFRFRGSLNVPIGGQYTFFLSSDDGSKLLINNQLVVDHDGAHSFEMEEQGQITLAAGQHDIEVQYFEISGGDALLVSWQGPQLEKQPIKAAYLGSPLQGNDIDNTNPGPELPGLVSYRYYEGVWNNLPNFANETIIKEGQVAGFDLSPRIVQDYYGFEFTANITVANAGDYTFYTTSDDGSRLSINGIIIVNNDGRHPPVQQQGTISLAAGTHKLKVDFFEHAGGDSLAVQWQGPGIAKQNIPLSALTSNGSIDDGSGTDTGGADAGTGTDAGAGTDAGTGTDAGSTDAGTDTGGTDGETGTQGLVKYQYYEGNWFNLPNFANIAPIKQGESAGFVLTDRDRDDFYAMQFTAKLIVPVTGVYTLFAKSDDGSRIYINGQTIVNNDGTHPPIEKQGNVTLSAGEHDIVVEFFEYAGGDSLDISWAGPGIAKQVIPLSALATGSLGTDSGSTAGTTDGNASDDTGGTTAGTTDGAGTDDANTGTPGMVNYQYFEGQWFAVPNFDALVPVDQGEQTDFSLTAKQADDNYGFRFAANLEVPADGLYAFYLASDDGSRLFIDGQLLIDNDGLHANREYNASQFLTAGTHHVLVEYFERGGLDTLSVAWSAAGMAKQSLASASLSSASFDYTDSDAGTDGETTGSTDGGNTGDTAGGTDGGTPGGTGIEPPATSSDLKFEYYEGNWSSLPDFDQLTPLNTGDIGQFSLPPSNGVLFYGYRFTGKIYVEQTGVYTFYTASNDGSQLHIDDVLVVDNNGRHGVIEKQGAIILSAGLHDISVTYFQSNGSEALNVYWSGANFPKQIIDSSVLFAPE